MSLLSNKVAIITGASSGIGRASAILFAREGASVVVGARRQSELDLLVEEIRHEGGQAVSLAGDVKSESYARALVDLALTRFGGLDIAFNNAGTTGTPGSVPALELAQWQETLDTNLTGAFVGAKYQIPAMQARGGGSLIFTSTFVGHTLGCPHGGLCREQGGPHRPDSGAGRRIWGTRGAGQRPAAGGTDTPMGRAFTDTPESLAFVQNMHALKRLAQPEEIARSALYLASDASSFTTGIALLADGGVSICRT